MLAAAAFDVDTSMEVDVSVTTESSQTTTTTTTNTTTTTTTTSSSAAAAEAGTSSGAQQLPQLRHIKLTSVLQLRSAVEKNMHSGQYHC